jgi:hypothetical protein
VSSQLLSVLLGGCLALAGTVLGVFVTHWLTSRDRREQRTFDEALRRRDWQIQERQLVSQGDDENSRIAAKMMSKGGVLVPPHQLLSISRISAEDLQAFCIPRDTLITMSDGGLKPVQQLVSGDAIRIYDANSHSIGDEPVENVVSGEGDSQIVINHLITVTPAQQVFCDGRYQSADSLRLGQSLVSGEFRQVPITSLENSQHQEEVFTVLLESGNGFFIRADGADYSVIIREGRTGKESDSHVRIRDFLRKAASGDVPDNEQMVFNPETGKFEVIHSSEDPKQE